MGSANRPAALSVASVVIAVLVVLPVIAVVVQVAYPSGDVWGHLASTVLPRYLTNTAWLMVGVGAGVLVIGVGTAWLVAMCRFPGQRYWEWALLLPLAVPTYVIAYAYTDFLQFAGPLQSALRETFGWARSDYYFPEIRSLGGAITLMTLVLYPYVYLLSRAAFLEQSVGVLEVGRTLGRGPWRLFTAVALPLARPAIAGGTALALMETLNDFGAVQHFGVDTFTTGIYRTWFGLGEPVAAAQLASLLLVFVVVLMALERYSRGEARFFNTSSRYQVLPRFDLTGWRALAACGACALPVLLGFALPAALLGYMAVHDGDPLFGMRFFEFAGNSVILATLAGALAVALALVLGYSARFASGRLTAASARIAAMGYAVPGSVIAVGVLQPLGFVDQQINLYGARWFGITPGLILTGSLVALIYAYLVRFLAVSVNAVDASLARVTPSMDGAARTLGLSPARALTRVHLPLTRGSLLAAGILVFVDVMKELPATVILRPFDFDTLAIRAYELASDERLSQASTAALAIVAVGIIPVILLSGALSRSRPGYAAGDSPAGNTNTWEASSASSST
ncbi:MAG: iron ABC transporter permease [Gammaproteobacteria bacterium]|nr:iron ABC transporter permease [Gammaproteobacteria bacterium]